MRRLGLLWRNAWWKLVLLKILLYSRAASGQLTLASSGLNFDSVQVGSSSALSTSVSNTSKSNITISQVSATGTGFSFSGPSLPITLAPQQNVNLYVTFAPQSSGSANGTLSIVTGSAIGNSGKQRSNSTTISLSGTGTSSGQLAANPSNLNFGTAQVGTSQSITESLTNSGGSSDTISQVTPSGTGFSLSGFVAPLTLSPGQSVTFSVAFSPTLSGTASGSLSVISDASDPSLSVSLSGTGTSAG